MDWPEIRAKDWNSFVTFAHDTNVGQGMKPVYLFRGQANNAWSLQPSLLRLLPEKITAEAIIELERRLLEDFQSQAHLHIPQEQTPNSAADILSWSTLMQHYGAPTRLLDFTYSAYVAAYFAVERYPEQDGAIWFLHTYTVHQNVSTSHTPGDQAAYLYDPDSPSELFMFRSLKSTHRIVAQQGSFITSRQVKANFANVIIEATNQKDKPSGILAMKLVIPKELKPNFLIHLKVMNITASALFPGLDGLGRSMGEFARMYSNFWTTEHP